MIIFKKQYEKNHIFTLKDDFQFKINDEYSKTHKITVNNCKKNIIVLWCFGWGKSVSWAEWFE